MGYTCINISKQEEPGEKSYRKLWLVGIFTVGRFASSAGVDICLSRGIPCRNTLTQPWSCKDL